MELQCLPRRAAVHICEPVSAEWFLPDKDTLDCWRLIGNWPAYQCSTFALASGDVGLYTHFQRSPVRLEMPGEASIISTGVKASLDTGLCTMLWNNSGTAISIDDGGHDRLYMVAIVVFAA